MNICNLGINKTFRNHETANETASETTTKAVPGTTTEAVPGTTTKNGCRNRSWNDS